MTNDPELTPDVDTAKDAPSSNKTDAKATVVAFVVVIIGIAIFMLALTTVSAADHPYTGSGTVKSHMPWGSAMCQITVTESNGNDHLYQRTGGLPFCQGVEDGAKVTINSGTITSITAR